MNFVYTAKSAQGDITSGVMQAASADALRKVLREQNLFPMTVKKQPATGGLLQSFKRPQGRVPDRALLFFTTQLSIMVRSGVDLAGALDTLAGQCAHHSLRRALKRIHKDITGGKSVSDSLKQYTHVFGEAYVASVAAGEASGELPKVLDRLSQMMRNDLRNKAAVRTLMAYPLILSSISMLVICGLIGFVLPQFADIFADFEIPLPIITQLLLALSDFLKAFWWLWLPVSVLCPMFVVFSMKTATGRKWWDARVLNLVLIRRVTRSIVLGRTFRMLGLMIESGVPLLEGLRLTRRSVNNILYKELFQSLEEDILNGRGLAASLLRTGFVPRAAAEMILTAEKSGTLGMVTHLMGEHYEDEGESRLRELVTIAEPLIIVVMGGFVAAVVMAVMLPLFDIATLSG